MSTTAEYEAIALWWNALTPTERLDALEPLGSGATALQAYRYRLLAVSHARLLEAGREVRDEFGMGDDSITQFERLAERFRQETGFLAPGKDAPAAWNSDNREERRTRWDEWNKARYAALEQRF